LHFFHVGNTYHQPGNPYEEGFLNLCQKLRLATSEAAIFSFGYPQMIQTDILERINGIQNASGFNGWAWAMFRLNPLVLGL